MSASLWLQPDQVQPSAKKRGGRKKDRASKAGGDEGREILAALHRPGACTGGSSVEELFEFPCVDKAGIADILQLYHSALGLSECEQKERSCCCQRLLWKVAQRNAWSDEVLLFSDHMVAMATDPHWNFVLQHIVTLCDARQLDLICARLSGRAVELSRHRIGCRVLCRICEQGKFSGAAFRLLTELASDISEHIEHRYSNFVVTKILEHFEDFPGMDAALHSCAARWGAGRACC